MDEQDTISLSTIVSQSPKILDSDLGEEMLIMHVETGKYINLKDVGVDIWRLLKEPLAARAIIDSLVENYDVIRGLCEKEVLSYLNDLFSADLIVIVLEKE